MSQTAALSTLPSQAEFFARCEADPELKLAHRHWTGGVRFDFVDGAIGYSVTDGAIRDEVPTAGPGVISLVGPAEMWASLAAATPAPFATISVLSAMGEAGLDRASTDEVLFWQYLPAVERASELLRAPGLSRNEARNEGSGSRRDSPVGGYVHVDLEMPDGQVIDHRIYYETAGQGIPMLLQHTAGAHSLQWRHLFEMPEITDHFQLIAYDLPYHGKSIPPVDHRWWEEEYKLRGALLRQIPLAVAHALGAENPVFMGCSVGGLLAIDLAYHHPAEFRAVISLEGAIHVGGDHDSLIGMYHPQVSNQSKARMMEALCAPMSPEAYVKEVSQVYSAGWPPAFLGDLFYYMVDFDLRDVAGDIDTSKVGVHIFNGDYDFSGHVSGGLKAHQAIEGSTHTVMAEMGHFPMQENPVGFAEYLLPVLEEIKDDV